MSESFIFQVVLPTDHTDLIMELMPEAFEPSIWSMIIFAINPEDLKIEGACLIVPRGYLKLHYVLIRSVNKKNNGKIVQALAKEAIRLASQIGIDSLYCWERFSSYNENTKNYLNAGFTISERAIFYEADVNRILTDLEPIYKKIKSNNKIPEQALAKRISKNDLAGTLALHIKEFQCDPIVARQRLAGESVECNYSIDMSTVLTVNEKVIGAFLVYPFDTPKTVFIYGVVVHEAWRGTWANVFLKYLSFRHLKICNIDRVRLRTVETNKDTNKHAARAQAKIIEESLQLSYITESQ